MEEESLEIEDICRLCLMKSEQLNSVHFYGKLLDEVITLGEILTSVTSLKHDDNDGLPENICNLCTLKLCRAYIFREICIQNDLKLRQKLQSSKNDSKISEPTVEEDNTVIFYDEETSLSTDDQNPKHQKLKLSKKNKGKDDENENTTDGDDGDDHISVIYLKVEVEATDDDEECKISNSELAAVMENNEHEISHKRKTSGSIEVQITEDEADENSGTMSSDSSSCFRVNIYEEDQEEDDEKSVKISNRPSNEHNQEVFSIMNGKKGTNLSELVFRKRRQRSKNLPKPPFKCEICEKILRNTNSYKYHMQLHSDSTPYLCSHCGEGFKTRNSYEGHMMTHNANNPHTCKICGKAYRQAGSLRSHMLSHTGEKPFVCDICGKGTTQKSGYKKHMLTHTGEKPYKCDVCGNFYRYSSNLIMHKRRHAKAQNASASKQSRKGAKEKNEVRNSVTRINP